ncbi:MAG TPA: bifunctional folylpolyglutamate synthase/dihydrofolate synthase [Edaphobacter sp.]|nr:bifunctional folylpolyglutamate synthase/dihydrofolate synthase [Edaphobacter sp.]
MSYNAAVDHLYARGLELATSRRKFELEHMRTLARALGDPQTRFPSVLIAGTNGKGSTAATLASILTAAGYRTALYTSPHLSRVNERIQIDGQPIPDDDFARLYFQVDTAAEQLVTSGQLPQHPSFFETLTAVAFLYFAGDPDTDEDPADHLCESQQNRVPHLRGEAAKVGSQEASEHTATLGAQQISPSPTSQQQSVILSEGEAAVEGSAVRPPSPHAPLATNNAAIPMPKAPAAVRVAPVDIAILEVGLGGRLDATNIVEPILSILTDISLDHQEYLGNTIAEITREKAGILRHHGTLITLPQHPEANQAIGEAAATLDLHAINAAQYIPTADKLLHNTYQRLQPAAPTRHSERSEESLSSHTASAAEPSANATASLRPPAGLAEAAASITPASSLVKGTASAVPHSAHLSEGASAPEVPLPRNRYTVTLAGHPLHIDSPLAGQHQQRNIALAIAAAEELRNPTSYKKSNSNDTGYKITNAQIEEGIRKTLWPGRLELLPLPGSAPILLDVAHNPGGAWTLRAALAQLPEDMPRTLLFSCLRDKDLREMSQILLPLFDRSSPDRPNDHVILAPIDSPRAASIEDLQAAARDLEVPVETTESLREALAKASELTPANGLIVATGSVYLIGELRTLILGRP